jgi:small subunit ribosomal protein S4e
MIKEREFTIRSASGPHPLASSMPLGIILRDVLNVASTVSEAKRILAEGKVLIDGVVRHDYKLPVGLMDVIYVKPADTYYRIMPDKVNQLSLLKITAEEASFKLVRLSGKRILKDKTVQLNSHDGRSFAVKIDDPFNPQVSYRVYDTLKISLPGGEILEHIPLEVGNYVSVIGGSKNGEYGTLAELPAQRGANRLAKVTIKEVPSTVTLKYIFPIGKGSPIITLQGEVA